MKLTINGALEALQMLGKRESQLKELQEGCKETKISRWLADSKQKEEETRPTYDIREVDAKVVKLQNAQFKLKSEIKKANATHEMEVSIDLDELLEPIKEAAKQ